MKEHAQEASARTRSHSHEGKARGSALAIVAIVGSIVVAMVASIESADARTAVAEGPPVWIGSGVTGTWGLAGDWSTTPAGGHTRLSRADPRNDWAVDLSKTGYGQSVYVYAAAANSALSPSISARVDQIGVACASGDPRYGGYFVSVGFYYNGLKVGTATYAHIDVASGIYVGRWISRWGTRLGTIGSYRWGGCWQGAHLHFELRSERNYACWNKGYTPGYPVRNTNFLGFIGGNFGRVSKPCP